jgi:hypothetical protein
MNNMVRTLFQFLRVVVLVPFFRCSFNVVSFCYPVTIYTSIAIPRDAHDVSLIRSYALTERQLQFWEDVDIGLRDIEDYYEKNGQDIQRIRKFVSRYVLNSIKYNPSFEDGCTFKARHRILSI